MKNLVVVLLAVLIVMSCNNETKNGSRVKYSDLSTELLKGDIASYTETPYKVDSTGAIGEEDSCCVIENTLDGNGNYVKYTESDSKGKVTGGSTFERFDNGMWKGQADTKDGKQTGKMEATIDDNGNYSLVQEYDSAGNLSRYYTNISQNEYAQPTGWKQYDKDSVLRQTGESKYDSMLIASFTMKDSLGNVKTSTSYKYNERGEMTDRSTTTMKKDSATTKAVKYTYDAHDDTGNWTQRTEYDEKGKPVQVIKRTYEYRKKEEK